jgi:hypothetical protein
VSAAALGAAVSAPHAMTAAIPPMNLRIVLIA